MLDGARLADPHMNVVALPDPCEVEFEPRVVQPGIANRGLHDVHAILAECCVSGEQDVAARPNEHQP